MGLDPEFRSAMHPREKFRIKNVQTLGSIGVWSGSWDPYTLHPQVKVLKWVTGLAQKGSKGLNRFSLGIEAYLVFDH